ncbi:MAG: hypothetical protein KKH88_00155 [Nanoarchaeota archaeon]|nr:hypothetical protein [Nanoarchaeota archaeon]
MGFFDKFKPQKIFEKREEEKRKKKSFTAFNLEKSEVGSHEKFLDQITNHSTVVLLTGRRGSGKSSLGMRFLELFHYKTGQNCYVLGYEDSKLPRWIKKVESLDKVPVNSTVLIDEGAIFFSSRDSMKKSSKDLGKIMAIARHKNLTLILIAQSSAMIDLNVLRLADIVLLKEPSLLQTKFERKGIKDMYERVSKIFKDLKEDDIKEKYFFVWSDDFEGLLSYDLPGFWSDNVSKAFRKF